MTAYRKRKISGSIKSFSNSFPDMEHVNGKLRVKARGMLDYSSNNLPPDTQPSLRELLQQNGIRTTAACTLRNVWIPVTRSIYRYFSKCQDKTDRKLLMDLRVYRNIFS